MGMACVLKVVGDVPAENLCGEVRQHRDPEQEMLKSLNVLSQ